MLACRASGRGFALRSLCAYVVAGATTRRMPDASAPARADSPYMTEHSAATASAAHVVGSSPAVDVAAGRTVPRGRGHYFAGVLDLAGTVLAMDRAGPDEAEWANAVGAPIWDAPCWGGLPAIAQRLRDAVNRAALGETAELELDIPASAGCDAQVVDLAIRPGRGTAGRVATLIVDARDLSARKEAEAELARRDAELQTLHGKIRELDALKMQFFATMSHELRTPLALILGSSERLITDIELSGETRHNAEVVARNARLLLRHVNDLLDIAKLEARKMQVEYDRVDLAELVRHTAEHFDALAGERRIAYVVETPESLGAQVDAEKVQRILLNLLSNAFKFTPAGGSIRILLAEAPPSSGDDGSPVPRAVISVLDSGAGVPSDQRDTIFERFRQGLVGATRRFGGTGLGLAIAKDFAELHGGTITVGDAAGGGAAFVVNIPLIAMRSTSTRPFTPPEPGIAIDMARQTVDELRGAPAVTPPPPQRSPRVRGVPPGQID